MNGVWTPMITNNRRNFTNPRPETPQREEVTCHTDFTVRSMSKQADTFDPNLTNSIFLRLSCQRKRLK